MGKVLSVVMMAAVACPAMVWAQSAGADSELARQVAALVSQPEVVRAHWGIDVTALDGTPIYSMNEGQYFQPASNTKLFTTAAVMALLRGGTTFETRVLGRGVFTGAVSLKGDVVIVGDGDANLSGRTVPYVMPKDRPKVDPSAPLVDPLRYLAAMADQVAATGLKVVSGDVVGDDTVFPWEPYPSDWSIDDMVWGYGAPVSGLTVNDNQLVVTVTPAKVAGEPATVTVEPALPAYYTLDVSVMTGPAKGGGSVQMERAPGSKTLRIYGTIAADAGVDAEEVAIHDPAEYAAMAFKAMLEARGVEVHGVARAAHRIPNDARGFLGQTRDLLTLNTSENAGYGRGRGASMSCDHCRQDAMPTVKELAKRTSPTLIEDVTVTNKVSQNLHAELLLHQLGATVAGDGSTAQGARVVRSFLTSVVGIDKDDFVFYDGSGLSGHDLVTPRATAKLLQFATTQPWFADWKKSLPVAGEDGSLRARFPDAPLKDHVFAKTGTLGEARALSGYVDCASGKTMIFSVMVTDHAPGSVDMKVMDKIVAAIAAAN